MNKIIFILITALLSACAATPSPQDSHAGLISKIAGAHGGNAAWQDLTTLSVDREHHGVRTASGVFRFHIDGDVKSRRIYQRWEDPAGELGWDGERAWSKDWPLAQGLKPRFVMSIGFYLIALPWLLEDPMSVKVRSISYDGTLPGFTAKTFIVLEVEMEADTVRKPAWFRGARDHFSIYVDPESYRIQGVMQYRTYAGQLNAFGAGEEIEAIVELYEIKSYVDVDGLLLPEEYQIYSPSGKPTNHGIFFNYELNRPIDIQVFMPPGGAETLFDTSSAIYRE